MDEVSEGKGRFMGFCVSLSLYLDKKHDSKYRRYVAAVEKCLQSFESVNEWADVISFLTRLGKVMLGIKVAS